MVETTPRHGTPRRPLIRLSRTFLHGLTARRSSVAILRVNGCSGASTMYVTPMSVSGRVVNTSTVSPVPSRSNVMLCFEQHVVYLTGGSCGKCNERRGSAPMKRGVEDGTEQWRQRSRQGSTVSCQSAPGGGKSLCIRTTRTM